MPNFNEYLFADKFKKEDILNSTVSVLLTTAYCLSTRSGPLIDLDTSTGQPIQYTGEERLGYKHRTDKILAELICTNVIQRPVEMVDLDCFGLMHTHRCVNNLRGRFLI